MFLVLHAEFAVEFEVALKQASRLSEVAWSDSPVQQDDLNAAEILYQ